MAGGSIAGSGLLRFILALVVFIIAIIAIILVVGVIYGLFN